MNNPYLKQGVQLMERKQTDLLNINLALNHLQKAMHYIHETGDIESHSLDLATAKTYDALSIIKKYKENNYED